MEARRRTRYRSGRGLLPIAVACLLCLAPAGAAHAAPAQQLFPLKGFTSTAPVPAVVNAVSAPDAQGRIVVGGDFTIYGQLETGGGAALTTAGTGAVDVNLPPVNGDVRAVASDGAGGYYIGGSFSCVGVAFGPCTGPGAVQRENLAHILSDGSVDPAWAPAPDQRVFALAVSGSTVYVGGNFTSVGGTPRNAVAAIDATGALADWNPRPYGSTVYALAVSGSTVYMGGDFTKVGGISGLQRNRVAAIRTGARTSGVGTCLDNYDTVDCVADWNSLATTDRTVYALAVSGSTVYVGGDFTTVSGVSREGIAAIRTGARTSGGGTCLDNFDTSDCVTSWNSVGSTNDTVYALAVSGSTVYVGGRFTTISGVSRSRIAAIRTGARTSGVGTCLDAYAAADCVTAWNPQANDFVLAIAPDSGTVYVGGDFSCIGGSLPCTGAGKSPRRNLAAVDAATGAATAWNPSADLAVYALLPGSGSIYVGGAFTYWGGTARNNLAQFDADGNLTAWNPDVDGEVFAVAVSGSTVYVGGNFNCVNRDRPVLGGGSGCASSTDGTTRDYAAAFDADTGVVTGWNPDADGEVNAVAVAGSTVYVGGNFYCVNLGRPVLGGGPGCATSTDGTARDFAAAFDAGTGAVTGWNPDVDGEVLAVAVSGSTVYVGGNFDCVNRDRPVLGGGSGCATSTTGTTRNFAAAFAADTARVTQWDPDVDTSLAGGVRALALGPSGVYLGGHFGAVNGGGALRANLAEVDPVTGAATAWNPGIGNPSSGDDVKAIATGGSTVYVGGDFTCIGGPPPCTGAGKMPRRNLAALSMATGGALPWDPSPDDVVRALTASPAAIFAGGEFEAADGSTSWRRYAKLVAVPVPPANVTATAGDGRATVSWTASAGAASYAVTASPGGATCTATGTSCTVTGLTNGTPYTFTVTATNAAGTSDSSAASAAVAPTAASPVPSPTPTSDPAPAPVPARMAAASSAALPPALVRRGLRADASGSVALRIGCTSTSSRCVASGALAGPDGAVLGRFGGVRIAAGEERGVVVRLAARPYARLRAGGAARVRVTVRTVNRQVGGRTHTATQRVWLHLPPTPRPEPVTG